MIVYNLAKRELKNNLRYWIFFSLNLLVGLIGFTFVLVFRGNVSDNLALRAKSLLTSDIVITGRRSLQKKESTLTESFLKDKISEESELIELYSMGKVFKKKSKMRLMQIQALKGRYPLIGEISLSSGQVLNLEMIYLLKHNAFVLISKEVAHQLKVGVNDFLKLGEQNFRIIGIIENDSTSSMRGMSLAPKVMIHQSQLKKTKLVSFGTVAWYSHFYTLNDARNVLTLKKRLEGFIKDPAIKVRTPQDSGQQIGRILNYLSDYLGLIGVIALLISMVGSSYLFQTYIYNKVRHFGILKSLGVDKKQLIQSYNLIILLMGAFSSVVALSLSYLVIPLVFDYFSNWLQGDFSVHFSLEVIFVVLSVGMLVNLLTCYPIFQRVLKLKVIDLLASNTFTSFGLVDYLLYLPSLFFVWGLCVYQSHSFFIGTVFSIFLVSIVLIVLTLLPIILRNIEKLFIGRNISLVKASPFNLALGFSFRVLCRNKISTTLTVLSLTIGVALISVIGQLDASIKSELMGKHITRPSLFLFDIQDEQFDTLMEIKETYGFPINKPSPMVRARLIKKNGMTTKRKKSSDGFTTREDENSTRFNNRGVNLSYALNINSSERIVSGNPFTGRYRGFGLVEISLEKRYAKKIDVNIGDTLTYEVMGVDIKGIVVNFRSVKWTSFLPNFFIILQPGVIEDAPKTYVAVVDKVDFKQQLKIQDIIVQKLSNVSIINVSNLIEKILVFFNIIRWILSAMSLCTIIVGLFVLYSILQNQVREKTKDFALQKIIGMKKIMIFKIILFEFLAISFISMCIGNSIGPIISYIVSVLFLDGIFVFNWSFFIILNTFLLCAVMTVVTTAFSRNYKKSVLNLLED